MENQALIFAAQNRNDELDVLIEQCDQRQIKSLIKSSKSLNDANMVEIIKRIASIHTWAIGTIKPIVKDNLLKATDENHYYLQNDLIDTLELYPYLKQHRYLYEYLTRMYVVRPWHILASIISKLDSSSSVQLFFDDTESLKNHKSLKTSIEVFSTNSTIDNSFDLPLVLF